LGFTKDDPEKDIKKFYIFSRKYKMVSMIEYFDQLSDQEVMENLSDKPNFITEDSLQNKYNLVYLSHHEGLLGEDDRYFSDNRFKSLYLANDQKLSVIAVTYDIEIGGKTRSTLVKSLIDKKLYPTQKFTGDYHNVILTTQGLFAWGRNYEGQLGLGDYQHRDKPEKVQIEGDVLWVSCGMWYTAALTTQGLFAWGDNSFGQLGLGHNENRNKPEKVPLTEVEGNVLSVSCGDHHTMALTTQGLFSWGYNFSCQLGLGHNEPINKPEEVPIEGDVLWVSCGYDHTMALTTQGLFSWGSNGLGQLGLGHNQNINKPEKVPIEGVLWVSCGGWHTMALTTQGLFAWGFNNYGQLGLGPNKLVRYNTPQKVPLNGVLTSLLATTFNMSKAFFSVVRGKGFITVEGGKYTNELGKEITRLPWDLQKMILKKI